MRRIAVLVLAAVLLCACGSKSTSTERPAVFIPPDEQAARKHMVFLVNSGGDVIYRRAAETFSAKVSEKTDGLLTVEVASSVNAAAGLTEGRAQLAFLDARKDAHLSSDFSVLSTPLLYKDYKTYTMALGATRMSEALNDNLAEEGILLLGAFYQGSNFLVADRATAGGHLGEDAEDEEEQLSAVVIPGTGIEVALTAYGLEVYEESDFSLRLSQLFDESAMLAEFTAEELRLAEWNEGYYLYTTNHSIAPCWLAMDSKLYEELSPAYQAVILEACAYLYPLIDDYYQTRESEAVAHMYSQGVVVNRSFDGLRDTPAVAEALAVLEPRGKYLTDIINNMQ